MDPVADEPARPAQDESIPVDRLAPLLRRSWFRLNRAFRSRIADQGITPDRYTVLRWLYEVQQGITQRRLAELMASDENTIAALVARMEADGLIERRSSEADLRCRHLFATAAGRDLFRRIQPQATALQAAVLAAIPETERQAFLVNLRRLADGPLSKAGTAGRNTRARRR